MMAGMTDTTVDILRAQANDIAVKNPPLRVLDTVILGVCFALGWVFGVLWRWPVSYVAFMALTIRHLNGKSKLSPFVIDWAKYNRPEYNNFFKDPPAP